MSSTSTVYSLLRYENENALPLVMQEYPCSVFSRMALGFDRSRKDLCCGCSFTQLARGSETLLTVTRDPSCSAREVMSQRGTWMCPSCAENSSVPTCVLSCIASLDSLKSIGYCTCICDKVCSADGGMMTAGVCR